MITPRLFRRSLAAGAQWRLLSLFWAASLLPTLLATLPLLGRLGTLLDHSTRAGQAVAFLDGTTLLELVRQLGDPQGATIPVGLLSGLLAALALSPLVAGAMMTAARSDEPLPMPRLLGGAGELFGRMLRFALVGAAVLGLAAGVAAVAVKLASSAGEKAVWAEQAGRQMKAAIAVSAIVLWLAHLTLDAGRAVISAQPLRRSAFLAWWAGVRLIVRLPLRTLSLGLLGTLAGFGLAAAVMLARLRLLQGGAVRVAIAWVLAQAAVVAVGWGKAIRIAGLAELARADLADRSRRRAFEMSPPVTSPPPAAESPAAEPPALSPARVDAPGPPALSPSDPSDS